MLVPVEQLEVEGSKRVFSRLETTRKVRYKYYLGDGDSKGFLSVARSKPYGDRFQIGKLECVGHVQKRMGGRLRRLRKEMKVNVLSDGLKIGGKKGRLTDVVIDSLQNYYGLAIRRNKNDLDKMKKDIWSIYYHKSSTDDQPRHDSCDESWCKFKQTTNENKPYHHKNSLDEAVMELIKLTFNALTAQDLLKKCLHGRTQNVNKGFNNVLWTRVPKQTFVGIQTFKCGTHDAVITFNEGNSGRLKVLKELVVKIGTNCLQTFRVLDLNGIKKADISVTEESKRARKRRRIQNNSPRCRKERGTRL